MKKLLSLKRQFLLVYIATMLLFSSIVCSYIYIKNRNYTQTALKNNYQNAASFLLNDIELDLDTFSSYSYILSQNPSLIQMLLNPYDLYDIVVALNADIEPTIQFILNSNEAIDNITIYADEEQKAIPSTFFEDAKTIENTTWYSIMKDRDGSQIFGENQKLYIITPIRNYHSQKIDTGFVKVDIDINKLAEKALTEHEDLQFGLFGSDGQELYSNYSTPIDDSLLLLTNSKLRGTDIVATFYIQRSLLQLPLQELLLPVGAVLVSSLLLSCLFVHYMNRKMFKRLEKITEQLNCVNANNFLISIADQSPDEIGTLAACINQMSQKIDTLFTELAKTKDREKRAEVETLRARIDPHFLYNIMNTINWVAMDGDIEQVCTITNELALYYRTNLGSGNPITTAENELENVRAYLKLQEIATSQMFDVEYHIDENLLRCETCDFILQPLAENAITHGIKPLKGRRGIITIELCGTAEDLYFIVRDNGVGMQASSTSKSTFKRIHYGIKNINRRIALVYGEEYGICLTPGDNGIGATATVKLPKKPFVS